MPFIKSAIFIGIYRRRVIWIAYLETDNRSRMNWKSILLIGVVLLFLWKQFGPADDVSEVDLSTAVIIDVRTPNEFANGHVKGAINLPVDDLTESAIGNIAPKDQPLILYCKSGGRSASATNTLRRWGYQDVYNLKTKSQVEKALKESSLK